MDSTFALTSREYITNDRCAALESMWLEMRALARSRYGIQWEDVAQEAARRFLESTVVIMNIAHARAIFMFKMREAFRDIVLKHRHTKSIDELEHEPGAAMQPEDELTGQLARAIEMLGPQVQDVIRLRLEGYTLQQTAAILNMSAFLVFETEKRAITLLQRLMSPDCRHAQRDLGPLFSYDCTTARTADHRGEGE